MNFDQRKYDENPLSRNEAITILVFFLLFLSMLGMDIISNYQPRKLAGILFVLFWIPLLFIHEFGHALMATLLGWKVDRIHIGMGYQIFNKRVFGVPMEIRAIPLEGFVQTSPSQSYSPVQNALIYFAGPGIELLIFFSALTIGGSSWMFTVTDSYLNIAIQSFAFAALTGAIINLIPVGIVTKEGVIPNDGLGILVCLFQKENSR